MFITKGLAFPCPLLPWKDPTTSREICWTSLPTLPHLLPPVQGLLKYALELLMTMMESPKCRKPGWTPSVSTYSSTTHSITMMIERLPSPYPTWRKEPPPCGQKYVASKDWPLKCLEHLPPSKQTSKLLRTWGLNEFLQSLWCFLSRWYSWRDWCLLSRQFGQRQGTVLDCYPNSL